MRKVIIEAAQKYYEGNPIITDAQFDELVEKYKKLNPADPIFSTPGWGYRPDPGKTKFNHIYTTIGSLSKFKYNEPFPDYSDDTYVVTMPKLDGGSVVSYYRNYKLQAIVSRGNGLVGIDITRNLIGRVPYEVRENTLVGDFSVRGELVISLEDFKPHQDLYSHPRNLAVATAQRLDQNDICKILRIVNYSIVGVECDHDITPLTKMEQILLLKNAGFHTVNFKYLKYGELKKQINEEFFYEELKKDVLDNHTLPTDGLVLCFSGNEMVANGKNEKIKIYLTGDIAYKFKDEVKETRVINIHWSCGQTGRLIPKVQIEENECGIGSLVQVRRANQVVPNIHKVVESSTQYNMPENCPGCQTKLIIKGRDLFCPNKWCVYKCLAIIHHIWEDVKPDGASDSTFTKMLEMATSLYGKSEIDSFIDFLNYDPEKITEPNHYIQLVAQFLRNWKTFQCQIRDIIHYTNIPLLGRTIGKRIEKQFENVDDFIKCCYDGFSPDVFKYKLLNENLEFLQLVIKIVGKDKIIIKKNNNIKYLRVAVTGKLSLPRAKWFKKYETMGVEKSGVSKDTDYVVTNDPTSGSSTLKAAKANNIPIISEEEFENILLNK